MKKLFIVLSIIFSKYGSAQECNDIYVSALAGLEFCNNGNYSVRKEKPNLIIRDKKTGFEITHRIEINSAPNLNDAENEIIKRIEEVHSGTLKVVSNLDTSITGNPSIINHWNVSGIDGKTQYLATLVKSGQFVYSIKCKQHGDTLLSSTKNNYSKFLKNLIYIGDKPITLSKEDSLGTITFGNLFFEALKEEDKKAFENLLPSMEVFKRSLETQMTDKELLARMQTVIINNWDEFKRKFANPDQFDVTIENGKAKGIKWKKIEFINFEYKTIPAMPQAKSVRADLVFKYQNRKFKIRKIDLTYLENKAYLVDYSINIKELK